MQKFLVLGFLFAALAFSTPSSANQTIEFLPGKTVQVLGVGTMNFTEGPPALMLKYQTAVPLANLAELTKEADAIWNRFLADVETRGFHLAILSANEPPTANAVGTQNNAYNFVYERGRYFWRERGKQAQGKIVTPQAIEDFAGRLDHMLERQLWNALMSVMAEEWTLDARDPTGNNRNFVVADPTSFVKVLQQVYSTNTVKRRRETLSVTIAPDRESATLESREFTEITSDALDATGTARLSDTLALQGDKLVWRRSVSVLEELTQKEKK